MIAGKGHEDYQIHGTTKHHFDDREEAAHALTYRWRRSLLALAGDCDGELRPAGTDVAVTRVTIDSRSSAPGALYVAIRGDAHDGHAFCAAARDAGAVASIVDHDVGLAPVIVVRDTRIAIGKLAAVHRAAWGGKLVAITGSSGKTTTKELVRAALAAAATTHAADGSLQQRDRRAADPARAARVPPLRRRRDGDARAVADRVPQPARDPRRRGRRQRRHRAHRAARHDRRHCPRQGRDLWIGLRAGGTVVRPAEDERLAVLARFHAPKARVVTFGDVDTADVRLAGYRPSPGSDGSDLQLDVFGERRELHIALAGRHAAIDACAALAAAHAAGASIDEALAGLPRARPLAMRGEIVDLAGRHVIVDCYNANPASMAAALRTLAERAVADDGTRVAVLGDMLELGRSAPAEHATIGALARELGIRVFALGDHAAALGEPVADPAAAARRALAATRPGDWLLVKASRGMRLERVVEAMRAAPADGS